MDWTSFMLGMLAMVLLEFLGVFIASGVGAWRNRPYHIHDGKGAHVPRPPRPDDHPQQG